VRPLVEAYQAPFALSLHKYDLSGPVRPASIAAKVTLATQLAEDALRGDGYETVHVRGCGFVGAAFALAAAQHERDVRIYTNGHDRFEPQRGSKRVLDPTVYDWPAPSWALPWTQEPHGRLWLERGVLASEEVTRWNKLLPTHWFHDGPGPTEGDPANLLVDATGPLGGRRAHLCDEETFLMEGANYWAVATEGIPRNADLHVIGGGDGALQEAILLLSGHDTVRKLLGDLLVELDPKACPHVAHKLDPRALVESVVSLPPLPFGGTITIHSTQDPLAPMEYTPGRAGRAFAANLALAAWYAKAHPDRFRFRYAPQHRYEGFVLDTRRADPRDSTLRIDFSDGPLTCDTKHLLLRVGPESRHVWNGARFQYTRTPTAERTYEYQWR